MTEPEWLSCDDPDVMLEFATGQASDRKLRLFAVACCRRIWPLLTDARSQRAVETVEAYADGQTPHEALVAARDAAAFCDDLPDDTPERSMAYAAASAAFDACHPKSWRLEFHISGCRASAAFAVSYQRLSAGRGDDEAGAAEEAEMAAQCSLLRDLLGNPFRPTTRDPTWLSPEAVSVAQAIYDERAFHRLPELADALAAAGCTDEGILGHCRSGEEHVRGCWVIDLIHGKS